MESNSRNSMILPKGPLPPDYMTADRGHLLISVYVCFITIEVFGFGLGILARKIRRIPLGWDDVLIIIALLSNMAMTGLAIG